MVFFLNSRKTRLNFSPSHNILGVTFRQQALQGHEKALLMEVFKMHYRDILSSEGRGDSAVPCRMNGKGFDRGRVFTLIELLVVIAIIAILAAML
ncbi:MAG: prepilin-type N-terminal cleavage/methylation domain-containing protein, partial [Victivallales bacterium]|nr:prepilin-type N-terminal cleavage/methylation domain-containing protein [Victivallales bacterium]